MIEEDKKIEYWNYLTTEKNQARPRGITVQRLAVVKRDVLSSPDFWFDVIDRHGAAERAAREFYQSAEAGAIHSRANFWAMVSRIINQNKIRSKNTGRK